MEKEKTANTSNGLKLNYKRTLIIGFAFFGILMLWQVYNYYCPQILSELLAQQLQSESESQVQWLVGIIMAMDNVVALFMLPLFGALSDKTHTKLGKRMPYIIVGSILSAAALIFIPIAFAHNSLVGVIIVMAVVLLCMQAYRNPAVSLMPDITPKPLRAKANGIINLVGYLGAIVAGAIGLFISTTKYFSSDSATYQKSPEIYLPFIIASALIIITMVFLAVCIRENKIIEEVQGDLQRGEQLAEVSDPIEQEGKMSKANKRNLILIIVAVFLWFAAFNAVETFWSNYSTDYLGMRSNSLATMILTIASLITFVPAGIVAGKIGRKWTIVIGIGLDVVALLGLFFISPVFLSADPNGGLLYVYLVLFAIAGIGWAMINCCSYPMVVEFASQKNVGKYTGMYYVASMLAQSLTPICLGALMLIPNFQYAVMMPYSVILFVAAGVVFLFVKNIKVNKVETKKGLEAFDQD